MEENDTLRELGMKTEWKRWRHCWQFYINDKKVGTVSAFKNVWGSSTFHTYIGGKIIKPLSHEMHHYDLTNNGWDSLKKAKSVVEFECILQEEERLQNGKHKH